jgi:hypothetical protein
LIRNRFCPRRVKRRAQRTRKLEKSKSKGFEA